MQKFPPKIHLAAGLALVSGSATLGEEVELSLADLMDIKIESVSKREESLISAPSAVYVLTADDLRRFGVRRLQDALRLVPGVVQVDRNYHASEFNIREDLVEVPTTVSFQLDGIPIQDPLFGAVYFRGLDLPIEEIDRIEVIRGNGGTVYGANSVTGVVSIYTKKAAASQGLAVAGGGGGPEHANGALRYGGALPLGQGSHWSVYGGMGYNKGYDADGDLFTGDTVLAPTPSGGKRVANRFTSDETGKPVTWNVMLQNQTEWSDRLKTALRFYARGMEDKAYARKSYALPSYTLATATDAVAPEVVPQVLSKFISDPTDIGIASQHLATGNNTAFAELMVGKGYAKPSDYVMQVLPRYVTNAADIPGALAYLQANDLPGFGAYLVQQGYVAAGDAEATVAAFQTELVAQSLEPVQAALTNAFEAAIAELVTTGEPDSAWITDEHFRSYIGNLRTDLSLSDDHYVFANVNGTLNDYKYSDYEFGLIRPSNWSLELEAQDILNFHPLPWLRGEWITGGDLRWVKMNIGPSEPRNAMIFSQPEASEWLRSAFVQGKATLWERIDLIAGIKGEQWTLVNDDIRWMPSVRLAYRPTEKITFWSAASRGTTVPGYPQTRMQLLMVPLPSYAPGVLPEAAWGKWVAATKPSTPTEAVKYKNIEGGVRWQNANTMIDASSYYMWATGRLAGSAADVDHPILSSFTGDSIVPLYFTNLQDAQLWGVEALVRNKPLRWLAGEISYAYHLTEITMDISNPGNKGISNQSPAHIAKARVSVDLPAKTLLAVNGEYYSSYRFLQSSFDFAQQRYDASGTSTSSFSLQDQGGRSSLVHLDATLSWMLTEAGLRLSLWGKNLAWWQWGYEAYDYQETYPNKTGAMYGADVKWGF